MGGAVRAVRNVASGAVNTVKNTAGSIAHGDVGGAIGNAVGGGLGIVGGALDPLGLMPGQDQQQKSPEQVSAEQQAARTFDPKTGLNAFGQSRIEYQSGINAPKYTGVRDANGNLQDQFKYDPNKSEAFSALKAQAMATPGDSPWAKMQLAQQGVEQGAAADTAAKTQAQQMAQAQGLLMRQGGLGGGARVRMAEQAAKQGALAQQDVARQGMLSRLGIQGQDIDRTQNLLGNISSTELQGQGQNLAALTGDVSNKAQFDAKRYADQMAAYGASKTAEGQRAAANSGKK